MNKKLLMGITSLLAILIVAVMPALAQAEIKELVSSAANSLCVSPTEAAFAPEVGGHLNFAPLADEHAGPFPDTGAACAKGPANPTAMGLPGKTAGPYTGSIPNASWVSPFSASGSDLSNPAPKYYIYDETFTLCENQVAGARIKVSMLADNTGSAFLNGIPIGGEAFHLVATNHQNFDTVGGQGPFGPNVGSAGGFKAGVNTLQFVVLDETPEFTGLDFSAKIKAEQCEPPAKEFPGLGRCVKVSKGEGTYKDAGCETAKLVEGGSFEWEPGPIKNHFTSIEGATFFEGAVSKNKVTCTGSTDTGEYIYESEDFETMRFTGCETDGVKCESPEQAEGVIVTKLLISLYGFIKKPKTVGVDLAPASGTTWAEFECGRGIIKATMRGSVISLITPISKMTLTFTEKFEEAAGTQKYTKFEGEPTDVLETSVNGGAFEKTGFSSTDTVTNEELLDLREAG
jgi:hypothetical protein